MNELDRSPSDARRTAFLRRLPARTEVIARRLQRFAQAGWDINGLALIGAEARQLSEDSRLHGVEPAVAPLQQLAELLDESVAREQLPDAALGERLCALARTLDDCVPPAPPEEATAEELAAELVAGLDAEFALLAERAAMAVPAARPAEPSTVDDNLDAWGDGAALYGAISDSAVAAMPPPNPAACWCRPTSASIT